MRIFSHAVSVCYRAFTRLGNTNRRLQLMLFYFHSFEKANQLLGDLYDCRVNVGTIATFNANLYEDLAPVEETTVSEILKSDRANFDETGMRVERKLHWFHVACTSLFCYFYVHAKRGNEAIQDTVSLLPRFLGWAVHDCWASYFNIEKTKIDCF